MRCSGSGVWRKPEAIGVLSPGAPAHDRTRKAAMSVRVILTPLFGDAADANAVTAGMSLAQRFAAHLAALFVRLDPSDAVPLVGEGVSPAIIEQLTQAAEAEVNRQRGSARSAFEAVCGEAGNCRRRGAVRGSRPPPAWHEATGRLDEVIPRQSAHERSGGVRSWRRPDEPRSAPSPSRRPCSAAVGRCCCCRRTLPVRVGGRVAIAWNGARRGRPSRRGCPAFPGGGQARCRR